jgi:hypothetical protein
MAISVVQAAQLGNPPTTSYPLTLGAGTGAGSTLLIAVTSFSASNVAISSSAPTLGGSPVTGTSKLAEVQSAFTGGLTAYVAIWMLPDVTGGATAVVSAVTNGVTSNSQVGLMGWEIAGIGTTPVLDQSSTSSGASTGATSGTTGATGAAAEIILGVLVGLDGLTGTPASPASYANQNITSGPGGTASAGGYQIQSSAGSTYAYANANGGTDVWAGAVVTVAASLAPVTAAPQYLIAGRTSRLAETYRFTRQ